MTTLNNGFEQDLQKAVLDDAERQLVGSRDNIVFQATQRVRGRPERYAREEDYNVEPILDSFTGAEVDRSGNSITVRWGYDHPAIKYFEFGTSDHTVEGDPVLVFEFDADEYPYLDDMFPDGTAFLPEVEVSGIEETRAIRDALHWLRREVES
ncbi:hypothetical protein ACFQL1_01555 [Halomicroarcula sp. GCM10025709]|uniref:hypothetical protein n=1 Tax=Halomicroarcula sp. GCM10025709 TaxID=3252669 RepID=UPI00361E273F